MYQKKSEEIQKEFHKVQSRCKAPRPKPRPRRPVRSRLLHRWLDNPFLGPQFLAILNPTDLSVADPDDPVRHGQHLMIVRGAGVDMENPDAVNAAMKRFGELVNELDELL